MLKSKLIAAGVLLGTGLLTGCSSGEPTPEVVEDSNSAFNEEEITDKDNSEIYDVEDYNPEEDINYEVDVYGPAPEYNDTDSEEENVNSDELNINSDDLSSNSTENAVDEDYNYDPEEDVQLLKYGAKVIDEVLDLEEE